jgi:hypothetical protein
MAEVKEKPKSKGQVRYSSGPKITKAPKEGDTVEDAGAPKEAAAEAEKTAGGDAVEANMDGDPGPEASEATGTEDIPVRHKTERGEMHTRHEKERSDMLKRHEKEFKTIYKRHESEMGGGDEGAEEE